MNDCKVVRVDGYVFVGKLDASCSVLSDALPVEGSLMDELTKTEVGNYFGRRNMAELITVNIGATSAVMTREFNDIELALIAEAEMKFVRANKFAVAKLVNKEFASLLGK